MTKYGILLFLGILFTSEIWAQSFYNSRRDRDFIASIGTGTSSYYGDLNNPNNYMDIRPSLNLGLTYLLNPRFSIRSEITWYQLYGDDSEANDDGRRLRNLSFRSNNFEINAVGMFNFVEHGRRFYQRPKWAPYAFAGIGATYFNPKAELDGTWHALRPLETEGVRYSPIAIVIPFGLGVRYKLDPWWSVTLEGGYRLTFTDYLDDVSGTYIDNNSFSDPIAAALADRRPEIDRPLRPEGAIRGNPDNNDAYFLLNIKFEYFIPAEILSTQRIRRTQMRRRPGRRR